MVYNINFFLIFLILKTFGETLINVYDFVILKIWFDSCITYLEQFLKFNVLINILGSKSWTRLSDFTFTFHFHALENEMATCSSVLAWRIPGTGEPGELPSLGSQSRTQLKRLSSSSSKRWWNSSWAISNPKWCCCESVALNMSAYSENSAVDTRLEKVSFHSNPKERQCQRMLKLPHNCTHFTH